MIYITAGAPAGTKKQPEANGSGLWCEGPDLNRHGVNHTPLKRARLPIPPPSRLNDEYYYTSLFCVCQELNSKKIYIIVYKFQ